MGSLLADDAFLTILDTTTGKLVLSHSVAGVLLAAGLLGEHVLEGSLALWEGRIGNGAQPGPDDELAQALLARTRSQLLVTELTVPEWIGTYRESAADMVAGRLTRSGVIRSETQRRFGRTVTRFVPVDAAQTYLRSQRIWAHVRQQMPLSVHDRVLAGLVAPTAGPADLNDLSRGIQAQLRKLPATLPPPLADLVSAAQTAVLAAIARRQ